jgi:pyrroline-5-carboxylate reductase
MAGPLLLVGCGKMGGAMLQGWLERGIADQGVSVVEPIEAATADLKGRAGVTLASDIDAVAADFEPEVVIFAVKPQSMDEVVPPYKRFVDPGTVFMSIAAGTTIGYFESQLGKDAAVVRVMPNTPAAVGRGMSVLCANSAVTPAQSQTCQALMQAVGEVAVVTDEGLMDAVTAVSGSGPAYVFLLIECLSQAGIEAGLPPDLARQSALTTVAGAGELARLATETPGVLRQNVTSPGGTTAAALAVLRADDGLQPLITRAVAAAADRSRELGG